MQSHAGSAVKRFAGTLVLKGRRALHLSRASAIIEKPFTKSLVHSYQISSKMNDRMMLLKLL
jgi:hypothetical protein